MRTAAIPSVRVEPALRDQTEFLRRGQASLAEAHAHGRYVGVDEVMHKLQARLDRARDIEFVSSATPDVFHGPAETAG